jgi:Tol biopolymer transport system component
MVSTGRGKTTCSFFYPDGERILYSSTHEADPACPSPPDYSRGYVWKLHPEFDIYQADRDGQNLRRLTDAAGYDAEATISADGSRIVFTSMRDGDLELYTMGPDGGDVRRITHEPGYDGGAFFSRDGEQIVWRASRPRNGDELAQYEELLRTSSIRPMNLEIFVARADGSRPRQVTSNGKANFAPYFFPDGQRIIFASNLAGPARNFDLWMVRTDGQGLEQVTFHPDFDGFPMFSPDGERLVFASNRGGKVRGETNIFLAEWVD